MTGEPVPDDRHPGFVFPTWREALNDAFDGVEHAYERRKGMVQAAYDAGLSFRQIGDAVGKSAATIHKIIGKQRGNAGLLDEPAGIAALDEGERRG